jgi:hypothetical protein
VSSLEGQILEHVKKMRTAEIKGTQELVDYYRKEIQKFEQEIAKKKLQLEK